MSLATATSDGKPSVRIVLLKGVDSQGFSFFTNYESEKGRELDANPHAALCFYWTKLERQIRISGPVERTSREDSAAYFHSRPPGSRIAAWASKQSEVIDARKVLDARSKRWPSVSKAKKFRSRRIGADIASRRNKWNSGRAGRT